MITLETTLSTTWMIKMMLGFNENLHTHEQLLSQRVAAIKHSSADFYIKIENAHLWEHIQRFHVHSFQEGVDMLK